MILLNIKTLGLYHGISRLPFRLAVIGPSESGKSAWLTNADPEIINFDYRSYIYWHNGLEGICLTGLGELMKHKYPSDFITFQQMDNVPVSLDHLHNVHVYDDPPFEDDYKYRNYLNSFFTYSRHRNSSLIIVLHDLNQFDKLTTVKSQLTDIHVTYGGVRQFVHNNLVKFSNITGLSKREVYETLSLSCDDTKMWLINKQCKPVQIVNYKFVK